MTNNDDSKKINQPKVKVKVKKLVLPVGASLFLFAIILWGTFSENISNLMGNSITNNNYCPANYTLDNNMCIRQVKATILGDVNNDGIVDENDISMLKQHIDNTIVLTSQSFKAADINQDGRVASDDLNLLKSNTNYDIYVCPDGYTLNKNNCTISKKTLSIKHKGPYQIGDVIYYHDSYWYVLKEATNYVTLIKADFLTADELLEYAIKDNNKYKNIMYYNVCDTNNSKCNDYDNSNIKKVLDSYSVSMLDDLKEVNGYKIRLITIEELVKLGFVDRTNTLYYQMSDSTPYWIQSNGSEYWVMNSINNNTNKTFMVVDYNNISYVYENNVYDILGLVRPVINLKKEAIK